MAEERITLIVRDAMVDCRRDQLWSRLMNNGPPALTYSEFVHLTTLVQHETLDEVRQCRVVKLNRRQVFMYRVQCTSEKFTSVTLVMLMRSY
jgi:hypothetical protein